MAIVQAMCSSFKGEILTGYHAFTTTAVRATATADVFKIALYTSVATLSSATTAYTVSDEVANGNGYTIGGEILTVSSVTVSGTTAFTSFSDVMWSGASFTAYGALIYNFTQGNRAVAVLSFGADKTATAGNFTIRFPVADSSNAILRIV